MNMAEDPRINEAQKYLYRTIEEANQLIPTLNKYYIRVNQMNTLLHQLLKEIRNRDLIFDVHEVNLSSDTDPRVVDTISSIKLLLAAIQKDLDQLSKIGIIFKSIENGYASVKIEYNNRAVNLLWQVGDESFLHWEEADTVDQPKKRPIQDLILEESMA